MWVKIYCDCGKLVAEVKPGSTIKKKCKCGIDVVKTVPEQIPFAEKKPQVVK